MHEIATTREVWSKAEIQSSLASLEKDLPAYAQRLEWELMILRVQEAARLIVWHERNMAREREQ